MAEQIGEALWRLDIPLVGNPLKNLNSYLLTGERNLLIDTGFRQTPCREAMERQLQEIGVDLDRTDIFLTHLHSDHTGLAPELIRPGCRIFISRIDGAQLMGPDRDARWRETFDGYIREGFSPAEMDELWTTNPAKVAAPVPYDNYTRLEDGDTLDYGGGVLRCVWTPGHTPGHFCLLDQAAGRLFSGDHVLFHITPNICRWDGVTDALGDYLDSLERTGSLPVRQLYPAHRQETGNLPARVAELQAHHARRIADAWETVAASPGLTAYEIAGRMAWSIRCRSWAEFPLNQKFFAVGETLAHLDYLRCRGRVTVAERAGTHCYFAVDGAEEK